MSLFHVFHRLGVEIASETGCLDAIEITLPEMAYRIIFRDEIELKSYAKQEPFLGFTSEIRIYTPGCDVILKLKAAEDD